MLTGQYQLGAPRREGRGRRPLDVNLDGVQRTQEETGRESFLRREGLSDHSGLRGGRMGWKGRAKGIAIIKHIEGHAWREDPGGLDQGRRRATMRRAKPDITREGGKPMITGTIR